MTVDGRRRSFLVAAAILSALPALAETWAPVGPPGGDARALASDPRDPEVVYLGTANGILYRSDDGGRTWKRQEPGFPLRGMSLDDIVVDPEGTLYVGYWSVSGSGGGVAKSDDGGQTFSVLPGISGEAVRALALAPVGPRRRWWPGTGTGIFRSGDAGRSWSRISPKDDPEIKNLDSVAIDPQDPQTIYAGTWHLPWKTDGRRTHLAVRSTRG